MKVYHVMSDIESHFDSLASAVLAAANGLIPRIPTSAGGDEDRTIARVCVAPSVEDCLTAIKLLGRFRRCLARNEDAFDYENNDEVYPIIILEYNLSEDDLYVPTKEQVPDVEFTHELWLLKHLTPDSVTVKWLGPYSIAWRKIPCAGLWYACETVEFCESVKYHDHPWLNETGHILDCSDVCEPKMTKLRKENYDENKAISHFATSS